MLYYPVAAALRLFNVSPATRRLYRTIGNAKNRRSGTEIQFKYFDMTPGIVATLREHGAVADGQRVLEMGTGWTHWDALILRSHFDLRVTLYDVWDNRSFERFIAYIRQLTDPGVRARLGLDPEKGLALMRRAAEARDFAEAYAVLGFEYLADPEGKMAALEAGSHDFVISRDVGEHLRREDLDDIFRSTHRILRPGGWAFHQIVLEDHIGIYDKRIHPKEYLRFDRDFHRKWIANNIQYTNLVQVPEWRDLFERTGYACVAVKPVGVCDLSGLDIHPSWRGFAQEDLAVTVVQFLLRKRDAG